MLNEIKMISGKLRTHVFRYTFGLLYAISGIGSSINDVKVLGGGVKDFVTTVLRPLYGGEGSKIVQNCVTSFMDEPPYTQ